MNKFIVISWLYKNIGKPIFFLFDPEFVHDSITVVGKILGSNRVTRWVVRGFLNFESQMLTQEVAGLKFKNPIGLAAGFDKNANLIKILPSVGFGFHEIGSITMDPYVGNPKPRLYRLKKSKGLVVYYGLKNIGVKKIVEKIKKNLSFLNKQNFVLGISVAKTNSEKTATVDGGIQDYFDCLKYLEESKVGDYYTINISCPNTFGGEPFTTEDRLEKLLLKVTELNILKPVFIKMPINLTFEEFDKLLKVAIKYKIAGVIIGNLTKVRDSKKILDEIPENIKGGISGVPTRDLSNNLISYTYKNYGKDLIIVGCGGIFSAEDAYEKIKRGATLLQLITGMIYQGPQLIGQINQDLVALLKRDGYANISEAIGKSF